ncbi:MAG: hypothetical protein WC196_06400 [Bacilli bacterium]
MKKPTNIKNSIIRELIKQHGKRNYSIDWHESEYFTFKTGLKGWYGICTVTAATFKPTVFKVIWDESGYWTMYQFNTYNSD